MTCPCGQCSTEFDEQNALAEYPGMEDLRASIADLGDFAWADEQENGRVLLLVDREPDDQPSQRARVIVPSRQHAWDHLMVWRRTLERVLAAQKRVPA